MVNEIKKWLSKPGNTKAKLAAFMGYTTTDAISKWILRGRLPAHQIVKVKKFLQKEKNK